MTISVLGVGLFPDPASLDEVAAMLAGSGVGYFYLYRPIAEYLRPFLGSILGPNEQTWQIFGALLTAFTAWKAYQFLKPAAEKKA